MSARRSHALHGLLVAGGLLALVGVARSETGAGPLRLSVVSTAAVGSPHGLCARFVNLGSVPLVLVRPIWGSTGGARRVDYAWRLTTREGRAIPRRPWLHADGLDPLTRDDFVVLMPGAVWEVAIGEASGLRAPRESGVIAQLVYSFDPDRVEKPPRGRSFVEEAGVAPWLAAAWRV